MSFIRYLPVALALLLQACASAPPPKEVFYRFDNAAAQPLATPVFEGNLRLEPVRAQGVLAERAILFSQTDSPGKLEQYRYHHWSKPPAQLVTDNLLQYLQTAKLATQIIPANIRADADYSIDGKLLRLERVIGGKTDRVSVELLLRLKRYSTRELVLQKRYQANVELKGGSMTSLAPAMSNALQDIFDQFVTDMQTLNP